MGTRSEYDKRRRAAWLAAGGCGRCGKTREPKSPGGATVTLCTACAEKSRAHTARGRAKRAASGACRECGAPMPPGSVKTGASFWCAGCVARRAAQDKARYTKAVTGRRCASCRKPMVLTRMVPGASKVRCPACVRRRASLWRERTLRKKLAAWDGTGRGPVRLWASTVRIKSRPLGPARRRICFKLNEDTMNAINALQAREREVNTDRWFRRSVAELLRNAIASVLRENGPRNVGRERRNFPGWYTVLWVTEAMYQQVTKIANESFDGSRAAVMRTALKQAVNPLGKVTMGRRRVLGEGVKYKDDWDD